MADLDGALELDSRDILEVDNSRIPFLPGVSSSAIPAHMHHAVHRCKRWRTQEVMLGDRVHQ